MFLFIVILLLFAAMVGVLGTVLKITAILVLSVVLAITVVVGLGVWTLKRKARQIRSDFEAQQMHGRSRTTRVVNEADPGELPARDDRY